MGRGLQGRTRLAGRARVPAGAWATTRRSMSECVRKEGPAVPRPLARWEPGRAIALEPPAVRARVPREVWQRGASGLPYASHRGSLYGFSRSGQASLRRLRASLPFPRLCRKAVGGGGRKGDCREKRRPRRSRKETRGAGWAIKWRRRLGVPGAAPATGRREEEEEREPLPPPESDLRFPGDRRAPPPVPDGRGGRTEKQEAGCEPRRDAGLLERPLKAPHFSLLLAPRPRISAGVWRPPCLLGDRCSIAAS